MKTVAGLRYEFGNQNLQTTIKGGDAINPSINSNFFLPSVNLSYSFNEKNILRLAYGRTLNRPEFREWSPFLFYNFKLNVNEHGSLFPSPYRPNGDTLKVATINNFDIRYEYYLSSDEYIHAGVFYKTFYNPIQSISATGKPGTISYVNFESAYSKGIELDVRKNILTTPKSKLSFVGNLSFIASQTSPYIADTSGAAGFSPKTPLVGQSPYIVNAGFYFQTLTNSTQVSLIYNVFGPRVLYIGDNSSSDIYELPRHTLDFSLTQHIFGKVFLTLGVQDIFNQSFLLKLDNDRNGNVLRVNNENSLNKTFQEYNRGTYYSVGIKSRF